MKTAPKLKPEKSSLQNFEMQLPQNTAKKEVTGSCSKEMNKFRKCLLLSSKTELFTFQNSEGQYMQNNSFVTCFVWPRNMISYLEGGTKFVCVR
jgi:hypothetical protein